MRADLEYVLHYGCYVEVCFLLCMCGELECFLPCSVSWTVMCDRLEYVLCHVYRVGACFQSGVNVFITCSTSFVTRDKTVHVTSATKKN